MKFYSPKGTEIGKDEFLCIYSNAYYLKIGKKAVPLENSIEELIYKKEVLAPKDFILFLRWKVGDNRTDGNEDIKGRWNKAIPAEKIRELGSSQFVDFTGSDITKEDLRNMFIRIRDLDVENLGSVYTLALVHLITIGKTPLYDKYADVGLTAAFGDKIIWSDVVYEEMPDKTRKTAVIEQYCNYKECINTVFGDKWKNSRVVDQALWTYGHMFNFVKKTKIKK